MPKEETADVKPPRDRRDSGPVSYDTRNGRLTVKTTAIIGVLSLLFFGGGGFFGIKQVAPDPKMVENTASEVSGLRDDVGEIKTELAKLNVLLGAMASDRDNLQKQLDAQQKAIDDLRESVPNAREVDELRRRIERLEQERK